MFFMTFVSKFFVDYGYLIEFVLFSLWRFVVVGFLFKKRDLNHNETTLLNKVYDMKYIRSNFCCECLPVQRK